MERRREKSKLRAYRSITSFLTSLGLFSLPPPPPPPHPSLCCSLALPHILYACLLFRVISAAAAFITESSELEDPEGLYNTCRRQSLVSPWLLYILNLMPLVALTCLTDVPHVITVQHRNSGWCAVFLLYSMSRSGAVSDSKCAALSWPVGASATYLPKVPQASLGRTVVTYVDVYVQF